MKESYKAILITQSFNTSFLNTRENGSLKFHTQVDYQISLEIIPKIYQEPLKFLKDPFFNYFSVEILKNPNVVFLVLLYEHSHLTNVFKISKESFQTISEENYFRIIIESEKIVFL